MHKLSPIVANCFVMLGVGTALYPLQNLMRDEISKNKFKMLEIMHHFTSGMKSLYSQCCYEGIDSVRQNCGGAGYSAWSMLPEHFSIYSPVPTYEGDNTVMA